MTWGKQNTEAEAHAQLSMATDMGINFIDTAELYPGETAFCIHKSFGHSAPAICRC